jgi:hypothetical protein
LFQSFLFATDAPAVAWTTLALAAYARGLATPGAPSAPWLALGSLFACLGGGARQSALLVVGALGLTLLLFDRRALRHARTWLAGFAPPLLATLAFALWYRFVHGPTETWGGSLATIVEGWRRTPLAGSAWTVYVVAAYTAFFALPLLAALPAASFRPGRGWRGRSALALCAAAALLFVARSFDAQPALFRTCAQAHPLRLLEPERGAARRAAGAVGRAGGLAARVLILAAVIGLALLLARGRRRGARR